MYQPPPPPPRGDNISWTALQPPYALSQPQPWPLQPQPPDACPRSAHSASTACMPVTTSSPRDGIGPEAGRLRLSHWAGPSVTGSAKLSQSFYSGILIVILTKGNPVPLAWEFIYKLGEVTRVTSTILPDMGRKCVTEA